ncbi:hypothetical protein [Chitinophaga qingshengii]|uniref:Uncharacterized protein n=1 Tax=Chitinophaga qingshengii TaxID=1569794 RepID=A0ABR7TUL0_9BACT|nr:hypothetical protein [Chitinophaga qingshengii]MBC9934174.1 hypothetical protein [Chitinophaga qingshengii]
MYDISEQYYKFLLEVQLSGKRYFTAVGADVNHGYQDKWLVDAANRMLWYNSPEALYAGILGNDCAFDEVRMQTWATKMLGHDEPYARVNLDLLVHFTQWPGDVGVLKELYTTVCLLQDYAIQVDDQPLLDLFADRIMLQFKDDLADHAVWGKPAPDKFSVDTRELVLLLKSVYMILLSKIRFQ